MTTDLFMKKIGRNIMKYRNTRLFTQKTVAEKIGMSYRYYQSIEAGGANITIQTLFRLAQSLDVHPCELLPGREDFTEHQDPELETL